METQKDYIYFEGPSGRIKIAKSDKGVLKFIMLLEGECMGLGGARAAAKYGYSKQRYYQLLNVYEAEGIAGLQDQKPGPKGNHVRTKDIEKQIIRHRFLDQKASSEVIAQKMIQAGYPVSQRSVERTISEYGLQKKISIFSIRIAKSRRQLKFIKQRERRKFGSVLRGI